MSERKNYDVIVIGAGPGGLTAALYAARANLKVVILDRGIYGGQMNNTAGIDNYPGFVDIQGPELGEKMYQTAMTPSRKKQFLINHRLNLNLECVMIDKVNYIK